MQESVRNDDAGEDAGSLNALGRALVPAIVACAAVALVVVAIRSHAVTLTEVTAGPEEPTPYSALEGRIPPPEEPQEPPPPTF